jgi:curved DNA-binding protein CbpA
MQRRDPYRILQVHQTAEADVIRAAYRVLARRHHPDGQTGAEATDDRRMIDLNWAYALLRDPTRRRAYDREHQSLVPVRHEQAATTPRGTRSDWSGLRPSDSAGGARTRTSASPADERLDFGRYRGWTLREVARHDIDYLRWLQRHSSGVRHRRTAGELLDEHDRASSAR